MTEQLPQTPFLDSLGFKAPSMDLDLLRVEIAQHRAAIERSLGISKWQPIESAPEEVAVLVCEVTAFGPKPNWGAVVAYKDEVGWHATFGGATVHPKYWMPIEPPPL